MRFLRNKQRYDLDETAKAAVYGEICNFFRAGGVLSTDDWDQMSDDEKVLAVRARALVNFEMLVEERRVLSAGSAEELVGVAAEHDPMLKRRFELERATTDAAKRMNTVEFAGEIR